MIFLPISDIKINRRMMNQEKTKKPTSGYVTLLLALALIASGIFILSLKLIFAAIPLIIIGVFILTGFFFINPNGSIVMTLFGDYKGTVKARLLLGQPFLNKEKGVSTGAKL